jgi:hypothetical protein
VVALRAVQNAFAGIHWLSITDDQIATLTSSTDNNIIKIKKPLGYCLLYLTLFVISAIMSCILVNIRDHEAAIFNNKRTA